VTREDLRRECLKDRAGILGHEKLKITIHQAGPFHPEQSRAGQVSLSDRPIAIQGKVARGREFIEISVELKRSLGLCPGLLQLLILHLQLNLVNLQFLNEPLGIVRRPLRSSWRSMTLLLFAQSCFRTAAQFSGIRWV
jgi:hypothetical protein